MVQKLQRELCNIITPLLNGFCIQSSDWGYTKATALHISVLAYIRFNRSHHLVSWNWKNNYLIAMRWCPQLFNLPVQLVMADLTFQHLDAEEDYIICRGHILISSAVEEAIRKQNMETSIETKAPNNIFWIFFTCVYWTSSQCTAFKSARTGIKFKYRLFFSVIIVIKLPQWGTKGMESWRWLPFISSHQVKTVMSKRIICSGNIIHSRHRCVSHKSLGNNHMVTFHETRCPFQFPRLNNHVFKKNKEEQSDPFLGYTSEALEARQTLYKA